MYAKNWTHPWYVRGAMNCATTNGQFVKGYVILYKWYYMVMVTQPYDVMAKAYLCNLGFSSIFAYFLHFLPKK